MTNSRVSRTSRIPNLGALLRGHFFAGLLVLIPIGVAVWMLGFALRFLWRFQDLILAGWRPDALTPQLGMLVNGAFTLGSALALALAVSLLGWISKQFLGRKILELIGIIIQRIPIVRSIYSALDQLLRTMAAGGGQQFSRVVYVEYPRKGVWSIAFVTGPARGPAVPQAHVNLFVPATPNPTSGFHIIVPEAEIRESQMTVEEAFKTILSLGIAQPETSHER